MINSGEREDLLVTGNHIIVCKSLALDQNT